MWLLCVKQMKKGVPIYAAPGEKEQSSDSVKPTASFIGDGGLCAPYYHLKCAVVTNAPIILKYIYLKII